MDIFEGKNKRYCKRLTKFGQKHSFTNKASRRHVCCEVCKLKSHALSHEPSSDCVIARAKGRVRAQASYGNITILSHLKSVTSFECPLKESKFQQVKSKKLGESTSWN